MTNTVLNEPIDAIENKIYTLSPSLMKILIKDKTTGSNLHWATNTYEKFGEWFLPEREMKIEQLVNANILTPRVSKSMQEQQARTKDKGEVFTPAWMCNKMNNFIDEDWFERSNVFNKELENDWKTNKRKIKFSKNLKKTLDEYISNTRLEITCGEAPYLVSRYDVVKGRIIPVEERIGILDRKLRILNENIADEKKWLEQAKIAYESTYGYDYQGDNVVIARENLLYTLIDNMIFKFGHQPDLDILKQFAEIVTWNIWQMDGIDYTIPYSEIDVKPTEIKLGLYEEDENETKKEKQLARIKNWKTNRTLIFKELTGDNKMKFDYIIGNPPYMVMDGGAQASASPVYQYFSQEAKKNSRISCLIQPSRWMTGGKGLDEYRRQMLDDKSIKILVDYADSNKIFNGVDIKGGVCVYLRDSNYSGMCECHRIDANGETISKRYLSEKGEDIFIRYNELVSVKNKVISNSSNFVSKIVSARKPYAFAAETMRNASKYELPEFDNEPTKGCYKILGLIDGHNRGWKYLPKDYPIPRRDLGLNKYKVFIAEAYGCGEMGEQMSTPVLSTPGELCTETFLQIGPFDTKEEARNMISYIKTKFFRALVGIKKQTQHTTQKVYQYVPLQDFTSKSDIDWSKSIPEIDKQLYKKYDLSNEEIDFIERNVKEME